MKSITTKEFRVDSPVRLAKIPTRLGIVADNDEIKEGLLNIQEKLSKRQDAMYAHKKHAVLICLQGMDTSGKDSLIREVFKAINSRGLTVQSFKVPNSNELEHDYLWRHYVALPERGKFAIFNRSHYENVLITRIHPEQILNENLPGIEKVEDITPKFWNDRIKQIRHFEKHLAQNGTLVLKFYLHLGKEEQRLRLLHRLENAEDNWKFSVDDLKQRERWDDYMSYYEEAINKTSKKHAPWFVIPADDKDMARYIVAKIIWEEIQKLKDISEPELAPEVKANIDFYKDQLKG